MSRQRVLFVTMVTACYTVIVHMRVLQTGIAAHYVVNTYGLLGRPEIILSDLSEY